MRTPRVTRALVAATSAASLLMGCAIAGATAATAAAPTLLCGYPPSQHCESGQTNPDTAQTVAPGILLAAQSAVASAKLPLEVVPWSSPLDIIDVCTTDTSVFRGLFLPKNSSVLVSIRLHGKDAPIGFVSTDARGTATLPALRFSRPYGYLIKLVLQDGREMFFVVKSWLPGDSDCRPS